MPGLNDGLLAAERMVLAVDTSRPETASELMGVAKVAGMWVVKLGLELATATSWRDCSELVADAGVDWIADMKLNDIPKTVAGAVENVVGFDHPPVAITIHTRSGIEALRAANKIASERGIMMLGVTHLTSIGEGETREYENAGPRIVVLRESKRAVVAGIGGLVASAQEVGLVKCLMTPPNLFTMIPGTRSAGANLHDQQRPKTPEEAVSDGADLLVIGRQVTEAEDPMAEAAKIASEIQKGLEFRGNLGGEV